MLKRFDHPVRSKYLLISRDGDKSEKYFEFFIEDQLHFGFGGYFSIFTKTGYDKFLLDLYIIAKEIMVFYCFNKKATMGSILQLE